MRDLEQMLASQEVTEERGRKGNVTGSLLQVYALFQSGDHSSVVACLRPMLDWTSDNFSQFLLGESEGKRGGDHKEQSPLSMLLLSLLNLKRWQVTRNPSPSMTLPPPAAGVCLVLSGSIAGAASQLQTGQREMGVCSPHHIHPPDQVSLSPDYHVTVIMVTM